MIIKYIDMLDILSGERFLDYRCANYRIYPYIKDKFYKKISEEYEILKTDFEYTKDDADFVACMEDVFDVYELLYNLKCPVVCIDEKLYQLLDSKVIITYVSR